jgi:histidyl-tRNA synthetase
MVKGTRLLTGAEAFEYVETIDKLRAIARANGYQEIIVSSLAEQQLFVDKAGAEILNQMYTFKDKGDRDICLIPEVTAVVQKWYKDNHKALSKPTKVFYVNRCYRYEKPQAGRYREFTQFGIECLGDSSGQDSGEVKRILAEMLDAVVPNKYKMNDLVKRGLSYYTEDGFEAECAHLGAQKQVAGGGRYDCGIGFGIGIERLILATKENNNG